VIEVNHGNHNPEFAAEFEKQAEKGDGVSAAGDSHANAVAGLQQAVPTDVGKNALSE